MLQTDAAFALGETNLSQDYPHMQIYSPALNASAVWWEKCINAFSQDIPLYSCMVTAVHFRDRLCSLPDHLLSKGHQYSSERQWVPIHEQGCCSNDLQFQHIGAESSLPEHGNYCTPAVSHASCINVLDFRMEVGMIYLKFI